MAKDLYLNAYERSGFDVVKTSLEILMTGNLERYGHHNYSNEQKAACLFFAPHLAGLFADFWNAEEVPAHDALNSHAGQLHGYDTAAIIADEIYGKVSASDLDFIVEDVNENESEAGTALYFSAIVEKIKDDMCAIIKFTSHDKREAMRKFTPKAPELKHQHILKPSGPKPPGYDGDYD